ncbi:hypothetical protein EVAR_61579_1 [Eumeta japonica]|uniref:Nucleic-acid-binding protein from transposon X-element n=1 Tax=Eumeta variegata TaxID=151549 RepID=A0A4C1YR01_EUMVA|nr:hypothetical protein EVAR_61579_1 [Eumeta japonica]
MVLTGVPKEILVEEVKKDLRSQNLPMQSVRRILSRTRESLDLVLVFGTAEANDKATKAAFFQIKNHGFNPALCVKCLGNHGTPQCTRSKDTDGPLTFVLCNQKGHTANYLGCLRAPKRASPPEKTPRSLKHTLLRPSSSGSPHRSVSIKPKQPSIANDGKLISIISIIDTNELSRFSRENSAAPQIQRKKLFP